MRNTYGVKGLMEWECQIRNGKTLLHVTFTGGTQTEYGVTPAKYSTDNPVIQRIIENSDYFKRGRITLLGGAKNAAAKTASPQAKPLERKTFSTLADAKAWLSQECGAAQGGIRTVADAMAVGKAHGVEVVVNSVKS